MHYDPLRHAYIDNETNEVVYQEDEDVVIPPDLPINRSMSSDEYRPVSSTTFAEPPRGSIRDERVQQFFQLVRKEVQRYDDEEAAANPPLTEMESQLYAMHHNPVNTNETFASPAEDNPEYQDWTLARTLQALEFEIPNEVIGEDSDFARKEYRASRIQIALLIAMIQVDGYDSHNSVIGPPVYSMVRFGAKEAGLIVVKNEWWRLISCIMLHAGIFHLLPNVAIQLRVGGYLNLVYGTPKWLFIYLASGIFGAMMSCIFLPSSVGVGSSGALMGMLSSWVVWIIFRWKKIPPECKKQRNCQLLIVTAAIVVTLATSAMPNVDWAAHVGGAIQGILWGFVLLSNELDHSSHRKWLRLGAIALSCFLYAFSIYYMVDLLHPSTANFSYWDSNDDWHK
eukprot:scaffold521_cov177-Ochromonas_danica.AAC.15